MINEKLTDRPLPRTRRIRKTAGKYMIAFWCIFLVITPGLHAQWLWDAEKMHTIKKQLHTSAYAKAYRLLLSQADEAINTPAYSVTQKKGVAPSGSKHDYVSLSRYWWPDPHTSNGLPYVFKDGQSNPELNRYDRNTLGDMCAAVHTLSLAYFYSGAEKYAQKAVSLLRTWFLDASTRMNPNLEYSQFIPGRDRSKGRPEGLIDSYSFVGMLSSVALLKGSEGYTAQMAQGLKQWFGDFAKWLQTSEQGQKEQAAKNNHATAYDAQLITYLLFSGDEAAGRQLIDAFPGKRIFAQIEPDGKQPNELWRTLAYHYSEYNLSHILDVCATAQKLGVDLLHATSADGRSIFKAVDYLASFLGKGVERWPYKQISGWEAKQQSVCEDMVRILAMDPAQTRYRTLIGKYARQDFSDRNRLLYGAYDNQ
ncbi:alginate lyase family protein [Niabella pedocola]|uniref:Alginate lyase family protein n=1 Tax=Niabella pedocola TaxID=1752077 RepID=A0ABS8PUP7_9BACT|nr:alginate lyase family protein [Niabella pedocola]MCD2424790.1 alginate lyase family protein [Niabella pedocola]